MSSRKTQRVTGHVTPRLSSKSAMPRIKAVRDIIAMRQCSHALITDPIDVEYICGFRSSNSMALVSPVRLNLFTDFRYMEAAKEFCMRNTKWKFNLIEDSTFKSLKRKLRYATVVGVQADAITMSRYNELERTLPNMQIVALPDELSNVSIQKTESEIAHIEAAANIGDKAFAAMLTHVKESVTEIELVRILESICADLGSEKPSFDTIVLFGERSALPHGIPSERQLKKGDFVLVDFGCTVNGFRSDMTRTFVFGSATDEQRNIFDIVLRAQEATRNAARAGMTCRELDDVARGIITESGMGELFGHATGHGIGLRVHEKPSLNKTNDSVLLENTVVTIEPGVYVPDVGGVRIEDMAVIKKGGAKILTDFPRDNFMVNP